MDQYIDTQIEFIGMVPAHWSKSTIRAITRPRNYRGQPDLPLLSVYRDYGVILKSSRDDNPNPEGQDLSVYKVVEPGNLVLNKMKTWQGSLGVSKHQGIVSPAYIVCELRNDVHPRFIHYLLRSSPYVYEYNRISYGVRLGQWDMRYDEFKRIPIYLPPTDEQDQIARFLDARLYDLSKLIKMYRRLVGVAAKSLAEKKKSLLHEYSKSLIAEVVTGKVDVQGLFVAEKDPQEDIDEFEFRIDDIEEEQVDNEQSQSIGGSSDADD